MIIRSLWISLAALRRKTTQKGGRIHVPSQVLSGTTGARGGDVLRGHPMSQSLMFSDTIGARGGDVIRGHLMSQLLMLSDIVGARGGYILRGHPMSQLLIFSDNTGVWGGDVIRTGMDASVIRPPSDPADSETADSDCSRIADDRGCRWRDFPIWKLMVRGLV
jgi:hypothetical protein